MFRIQKKEPLVGTHVVAMSTSSFRAARTRGPYDSVGWRKHGVYFSPTRNLRPIRWDLWRAHIRPKAELFCLIYHRRILICPKTASRGGTIGHHVSKKLQSPTTASGCGIYCSDRHSWARHLRWVGDGGEASSTARPIGGAGLRGDVPERRRPIGSPVFDSGLSSAHEVAGYARLR